MDVVDTIADLRATAGPPGPFDVQAVLVCGYHELGDAGGGTFHWDAGEDAPDDQGTIISPNAHFGPGRWVRQVDGDRVSVRWFGARGDGLTDDAPAIQRTIDTLPSLAPGRSAVFLPAGEYICNDTISLPVSIQGLEIHGAGWTETDPSGTTIRNTSSGPLFQTSGTGTCAFLKMGNFRLLQSTTSGYYFQFDNLTVYARLERIHCNMSNTAAGAVLTNEVECHLNLFEDMKVVTNGATVPMFHIKGPVDSNITTSTFRRITINTPNSTAPQILVEHNYINGAVSFTFDTLNIEQPDGGGVHLYGIAGAVFTNCIASDTSSHTAPVFLFDKKHTEQAFLDVTMVNCHALLATPQNQMPDIQMNIPTVGGPGPGPLNLIGGRFNLIDNGPYSVNGLGSRVATQAANCESILHVNLNGLTGVQGIQDVADPNLIDRAQNHDGFAEFASSDTVTVIFPADRLEPDTDYRVQVSGEANETFWVRAATKQVDRFEIKSSNATSTARVVWTLVRGV